MRLILLLVLLFAVATPRAATAAESERTVRVIALQLEGGGRSKVNLNSPGQFARTLIPLFGVGQLAANKERSQDHGDRLDETLAGYDRATVLYDAVVAEFGRHSPMFELERGTFRYSDFYNATMRKESFPQGADYVLVLNEPFSGLAMFNGFASKDGRVAPIAVLEALLYDGRTRKTLLHAKFTANTREGRPVEAALNDRSFFVDAYPAIARLLASQLVGQLNREDVLHAMAATAGRGDEVPPIGKVMERYAKRFRFQIDPPPGWRRTKFNSRYVVAVEPADVRNQLFGIRLEVDLLLPEFGQDVHSIDEYLDKVRQRMLAAGGDPESLVPFDGLTMPPGYRILSQVTDPAHDGRTIMAVRMLDGELVEMVHVIFARDFTTAYPAHRAEIEQALARSRVELRR
jgi:hypothetical protein